jgi:Fur family transcriptional regulator, peroxide stress response regulator
MNNRVYRNSRQRSALYEYLCSTTSHPTAEEIYTVVKQEIPHLSFGTVYRNLGILEEQGKVRRLSMGTSFDRFDAITEAHYHFLCDRCGRVYDLPMPVDRSMEIKVEEITGHTVNKHEQTFHGVCASCKARNPGE